MILLSTLIAANALGPSIFEGNWKSGDWMKDSPNIAKHLDLLGSELIGEEVHMAKLEGLAKVAPKTDVELAAWLSSALRFGFSPAQMQAHPVTKRAELVLAKCANEQKPRSLATLAWLVSSLYPRQPDWAGTVSKQLADNSKANHVVYRFRLRELTSRKPKGDEFLLEGNEYLSKLLKDNGYSFTTASFECYYRMTIYFGSQNSGKNQRDCWQAYFDAVKRAAAISGAPPAWQARLRKVLRTLVDEGRRRGYN